VKGTQLFRIIGKEKIETNSSHHQSINQLGDGLAASAFAEDGVIEAVESARYPFALGVQWHPEYLADQEDHLKLFQALVEAARVHLR
jgi:putative glutamine amidotransferase